MIGGIRKEKLKNLRNVDGVESTVVGDRLVEEPRAKSSFMIWQQAEKWGLIGGRSQGKLQFLICQEAEKVGKRPWRDEDLWCGLGLRRGKS